MLLGEAFVKVQGDLKPLTKSLAKGEKKVRNFVSTTTKMMAKGGGFFGGLTAVATTLTSILGSLFSILSAIAKTVGNILVSAFQLLISVIKAVISFILRLTATIVALIAVIDTLVIGLVAVSVKAFASFEQGMMNVQSVIQDSQEILMSLAEAAKDFGEKFAFSATQAADAMYFLGSAGYDAVQIMDTFPATLKLAAATQANLAVVTETVVNNINAFGLSTAEADRIANVFAATIASSQATLEKLRVSMGYAAPIARALGISVETTAAAMGILYNRGLEASMAGTGLRMSMTRLAAPTRSAYKILKQLGLTAEDVNPELHSLADILDTLQDAGAGLAEISGMIGVRAGTTFLNLISAGGDELRRFTAEITDTNKATLMAAIQLDTLSATMRKLWIHIKNVGIAIGQKLAPYIRNMTEYVGELLDRFEDWIGGAKDPFRPMMETIAELITKAAPFFDMITQWMISLIKWITQLHYIVIRAIGTILERVPQILDVVKTLFMDIFNSFKSLLSAMLRAMKGFSDQIILFIVNIVQIIGDIVGSVLGARWRITGTEEALDDLQKWFSGINKITRKLYEIKNMDISTVISTAFEDTPNNVKKLVDEIKKLGIELGDISRDPALRKIGEYFEDLAKKATGATKDIIKGLADALLAKRQPASMRILYEELGKLEIEEPPELSEERKKRLREWEKIEKRPWIRARREKQLEAFETRIKRRQSSLRSLEEKQTKYYKKMIDLNLIPQAAIAAGRLEETREKLAKIKKPEEMMPKTWQFMTKEKRIEQKQEKWFNSIKTVLDLIADNTGAGFGLTQ